MAEPETIGENLENSKMKGRRDKLVDGLPPHAKPDGLYGFVPPNLAQFLSSRNCGRREQSAER